jgi:hypothetical protein
MLSRITACCLAVLVLTPFTAPFRTVDLAVLFGDSRTHDMPANPPASTTVASDTNLASVPAIARVGRVRLVPLSGALASAVVDVSASAGRFGVAARSTDIRQRGTLATILRV